MRPFALAASCTALLLALGARAHAEEPESDETEKPAKSESAKLDAAGPAYPPPATRWGVIGVGLATSAFFYGAAAGMSYAFPDAPGAKDLRTPIVGPWMAIAHNGCAPGDDGCSEVWIVMRSIATAIGGLAQAGGLLVAVEGVFMPTQYTPEGPVRRAPKSPATPSPTPSTEPPKPGDKNLFWIPTPMAVGNGGMGVGVVGRF